MSLSEHAIFAVGRLAASSSAFRCCSSLMRSAACFTAATPAGLSEPAILISPIRVCMSVMSSIALFVRCRGGRSGSMRAETSAPIRSALVYNQVVNQKAGEIRGDACTPLRTAPRKKRPEETIAALAAAMTNDAAACSGRVARTRSIWDVFASTTKRGRPTRPCEDADARGSS